MRKLFILASIVSASAVCAVGAAQAVGGSDVAAHIREENAACDAQRRGELPPTPSYCLPELPLPSDTRAAGWQRHGY